MIYRPVTLTVTDRTKSEPNHYFNVGHLHKAADDELHREIEPSIELLNELPLILEVLEELEFELALADEKVESLEHVLLNMSNSDNP